MGPHSLRQGMAGRRHFPGARSRSPEQWHGNQRLPEQDPARSQKRQGRDGSADNRPASPACGWWAEDNGQPGGGFPGTAPTLRPIGPPRCLDPAGDLQDAPSLPILPEGPRRIQRALVPVQTVEAASSRIIRSFSSIPGIPLWSSLLIPEQTAQSLQPPVLQGAHRLRGFLHHLRRFRRATPFLQA